MPRGAPRVGTARLLQMQSAVSTAAVSSVQTVQREPLLAGLSLEEVVVTLRAAGLQEANYSYILQELAEKFSFTTQLLDAAACHSARHSRSGGGQAPLADRLASLAGRWCSLTLVGAVNG